MIERIFLGWDEPLLPLAARFLCDRYGAAGVVDLKRVRAVLPGSRGGRRLKELLLDEATRRGLRLVPPGVVRAGDLAELFYEPDAAPADGFVVRQVWSEVLRGEAPETIASLFSTPPAAEDLAGWGILAEAVARLHREVAGGGLLFRDVARVCGTASDLLFDDADRWTHLARLQDAYRDRLGRLGLRDVDFDRIDRLSRGGLATPYDVWLIGVSELPPVVRRIVGEARGEIGALVHAPETGADGFDELGLVKPAAWAERDLDVPGAVVRIAGRPTDQASAVFEEICRLGDVRTGDVVVAQTDETLVPYLRDRLESAGLPIHYAGGHPVETSRPYELLMALADHLATGEWEAFAALMRHRDFEAWIISQGSDVLALAEPDRLDDLFAEHLPARLRAGGPAAGRRGRLESIRRVLEDRLLASLRGTRPLGEWAEHVLDVLAAVYETVGLGSRPAADRRVTEVLARIAELGLRLKRLPAALSPSCDASMAIRVLCRELRAGAVPEEAEGAPIELLGWLELPLDDAPFAIVAGVNEGALPESVNAHPFLPDSLRSELGLLDNDARYARDAYHLLALLASRKVVRLIGGRVSATGDPLRPSRLLLATRGEELARRVRTFLDGDGSTVGEAPIVTLAGSRNLFALPPEPILTFEPPSRISVTQFSTILDDPYRFVLESVLRLTPADDAARELDGLGFGSLAHAVLERFGGSPERDSSDDRAIAARLDALLDEEAGSRFGPDTFAAVHVQIEQLRLRLRRFAEWQARRTRDGWRIVLVEGASPDGERRPVRAMETLFDVDGDPIVLTGRIDRIDYLPAENRWALLDYKTGDRVEPPERTHRRSGAWVDLQLPLYRHLAAAILDGDGSPLIPANARLELGYIRLPRDLRRIGIATADWSPEELALADEAARDAVRHLRSGTVAFDRGSVSPRSAGDLAPLLGCRQLVAAEAADGPADGPADGDDG